MTEPVISLHKLQLEPRPEAHKPPADANGRFECRRAFLRKRLGLSKIGCNVTAVAPGHTAYPYHSHRANDELFLILAGEGELRLGAARHPVREGDLIGCPAGDKTTAHQLINTGTTDLRYLAISTLIDPEIAEYPDSGKIGSWAGDGEGALMHLSLEADAVDYWHGE